LFFAALKTPPPSHNILASVPKRNVDPNVPKPEKKEKKQIHFFNMDKELVYWNFFLDFGPLNLGQLVRFSQKLNDKLKKFPVVCFYSSTHPAKRTNAIYLMCAWQVLYLSRSPEEAYRGFDEFLQSTVPTGSRPPVSDSQGAVTIAELPPFHDASPIACTYDLTVMDCLKGIIKARQHGFFDLDSFNLEEYEYFEQVEVCVWLVVGGWRMTERRHERCNNSRGCLPSYFLQNGDLNWFCRGDKIKILAFAGPSYLKNISPEGYCTLAPADYIPYFKKNSVDLVVRLNKKNYDEEDFVRSGIRHVEHFFIDGSCPSMKTLQTVLDSFESVPEGKGFAVHCKAGLGRTGTCIGAYLMKHYRFTAAEVIGWMRVCRPGCVIGPQQHFLKQIESRMWQAGASSRIPMTLKEHAVVPVSASDTVSGRPGQGASLLAARGGRRSKAEMKASIPIPPITPESSNKRPDLVPVTPDSRGGTPQKNWFS
jgi:cell division cycle 14